MPRRRRQRAHLDPFQDLVRSVTVFLLSEGATRADLVGVMNRALADAEEIQRDSQEMANLYVALSKVLHAWHEDRRFLDADAKPRPLRLKGPENSIEYAARIARVRVPYGRLLQSLVDQRLIRHVGSSRYLPTKSVAKLVGDGPEVTGYVGQSILQLIQTLESNRKANRANQPLLERAAIVDDLSPAEAAAFRRFSGEQGNAFIANANSWLESRRQASKRHGSKRRGLTAGVHVFAFVAPSKRARVRP